MKDIESEGDIFLLVNEFYKRVVKDDLIGPFFTEIIKFDWDVHIPLMIKFWSSVLLGKAGYVGRPIDKHIAINKVALLLPAHFERWKLLWAQTINTLFLGPVSNDANKKADIMARLMLHKIEESNSKNFIL